MSLDLNRASLIGTMATDPVQRMAGTVPVCNFRISTARWGKDKQTVEYHNVVCWDKLAENISTFLGKGSRVFIEGRLQTREWVAVDGVKKQTTEIVADQVIFLDKKDAPARSIQSIIAVGGSGAGINTHQSGPPENVRDFVMESMDKQDNVQEIKLEDIPF